MGQIIQVRLTPAFVLLALYLSLSTTTLAGGDSWPEYRGPHANGHSDAHDLPLTWSAEENVRWQTKVFGQGWSSPVVWKDQIWMTTATDDGKELYAVCVDRTSGSIVHQPKVFDVEEPEKIHTLNTYASPSPVIEEGRVYVHFGTYGTAALNTQSAEIIWTRRDLRLTHRTGPGSSPIVHGELLVFHCDGADVRYVIALDKQSGDTVWKTPRSNDVSHRPPPHHKAFSTPIVATVDGEAQLISTGAHAVMGYDPRDGREIWRVRYDGFSNVSRPLQGHGLFFINTGYEQAQLLAIKEGGRGDITESHIAWRRKQGIPKKPSPLLIDNLIYLVTDNGIATCIEAKTGDLVWRERLPGEYSASPIYADGRIYYFNQDGDTIVVQPGRTYKHLATNHLAPGFMASPAVAGGAFYLRTKTHLVRVEELAAAAGD